MTPGLSIIIPCLNEANSLEKMVPNIQSTVGLDDYEIIVINSGGTETSLVRKLSMVRVYDSPIRLGAPQARNLGANKSTGDKLAFADAHLQFNEGWGTRILRDLENNQYGIISPRIVMMNNKKVGGCGLRWSNLDMSVEWLPCAKSGVHEIPFSGGACMVVQKKVFDEIGQFDSDFRFWGLEDSEISIRAWLLGYRVLCDPSINVAHEFRSSFPYEVEWIDFGYNKIRLAFSHFSSKRLAKFIRSLSLSDPKELVARVLQDNALDRREMLFNKRLHNDDWFFEKFHMNGWD